MSLMLHEMLMASPTAVAGPTVSLLSSLTDSVARTSYTLGPITTPSDGLLIVLVSSANSNRNIASVSFGGQSGTVAELYSSSTARPIAGIVSFPVVGGTTSSFAITFTGSVKGCVVSTFMMTNYTSATPSITSTSTATTLPVSTTAVNIPANSYTFVVGSVRTGGGYNSSGLSLSSAIVDYRTPATVNEVDQIVGHFQGASTAHVETLSSTTGNVEAAIVLASYI